MKKLTAIITMLALTIGMTVTASASQTITFDEEGNGTVTVNTEKKGYLALGADLNASQKATVLALLGVNEAELGDYDIVTTTNAEEHAALDKYIDPAVIGKRSLSSVLVTPTEKGSGVVVTTHNINYCTTNMYRNALITAGVTDANIVVAAPTPISGTAALLGALKAYGHMSGVEISEKAIDTSLNELVMTGQLGEAVGSDDQAEELIAYIKTVVATNDLNTKEEIEAAIRKGMKDMAGKELNTREEIEAAVRQAIKDYNEMEKSSWNLSEDEINQIVDLMVKVKAMGIDYKVLAEQADDIYAKYKDDIKAGTFDISKVDLNDLQLTKIVGNAITNTVKNIGNSIAGFFTKLFQ